MCAGVYKNITKSLIRLDNMEKSMHGKNQDSLVLKTGKDPMDNIYLCFAEKIRVKYGIYRWIDRYSSLVFRHMGTLFNEASSVNNSITKKYINYLQSYKSVFNLTANKIQQTHISNEKQLSISQNLSNNMQLHKNIYLELKQLNNQELNRIESKSYSTNEFFNRFVNIQKEKQSSNTSFKQAPVGSEKVKSEELRYMEQQQRQQQQYTYVKRAANEPSVKLQTVEKQTVGVDLHYHINPDNEREAQDSVTIKTNTVESSYTESKALEQQKVSKSEYVSSHMQLNQKIFTEALHQNTLYINTIKLIQRVLKTEDRNILLSKKGVIHKKDEAFSEIIENETKSKRLVELVRSMTAKLSETNLQTLDIPLRLNNIKIPAPVSHFKLRQMVKNKDFTMVFRNTKLSEAREAINTSEDNALILLKTPKQITADTSEQQLCEDQPVRKETLSRTFTRDKENKSIKNIGADEINLLADRVYKILEKRIEIRKDRRGLR